MILKSLLLVLAASTASAQYIPFGSIGGSTVYGFSRSITVRHGQVGATEANYPVLVFGTYSYLATVANGGKVQNTGSAACGGQATITCPFDLAYGTNATSSTPLNWEIDNYSATTGELAARIEIPSLSNTVDTIFYECYGASTITTFQSPASPWNSNYRMASHFGNGSSLSTADATGIHTLVFGSNTTAVTGQIYGGVNTIVTSTNTGITPTSSDMVGNAAIEFWLNPTSTAISSTTLYFVCSANACGTTGHYTVFGWGAGGTMIFTADANDNAHSVQSSTALTTGWHHVVAMRSASAATKIYLDGADVTTASTGGNHWGDPINCGVLFSNCSSSFVFLGSSDEFRMFNIQPAPDWVTTDFNNESSPSTFYTVGTENIL